MIEKQTAATAAPEPPRDLQRAMLRGAAQHCPACGQGDLYRAYLKVNDACPACHEELHHHRADDAPPYFTMLVTGHVIVGALMGVETAYAPPLWVHAILWAPLVVLSSLWLLPRIKGALIGMQWALRMHGFGGRPDEVESAPVARVTGN